MRVTTKGQVTIPKEIRDQLGIRPGSEMEMSISRNAVVMRVHGKVPGEQQRRAAEIRAYLERQKGTLDLGGMSTDEYIEMMRGPREDLDSR